MMIVYVSEETTICKIFKEAAAKQYAENPYENFIDKVFAYISSKPTTRIVKLSALLDTFNRYSFSVDKFVRWNSNSLSFSYKSFSVNQTDKIFALIPQFCRPSLLNDYESVLINLFCIANAGTVNLPATCNKDHRTEILKFVHLHMFKSLVRCEKQSKNQLKQFFTDLVPYHIPFTVIDDVLNEGKLNSQYVDFSRRVKKKCFKSQDRFFFVSGNDVIFKLPNSPHLMQRVEKFLMEAKDNFQCKKTECIEDEFLDYLQELIAE